MIHPKSYEAMKKKANKYDNIPDPWISMIRKIYHELDSLLEYANTNNISDESLRTHAPDVVKKLEGLKNYLEKGLYGNEEL